MRYRIGIADAIHIGRSCGTSCGLDNDIKLNEKQKLLLQNIADDFISQFDSAPNYGLGGHDCCDFGWLNNHVFCVGFEPSYQWEHLLTFRFDFEDKDNSRVLTGTAFGPYGSNIAVKIKYLKDYKRKTKFTNFINKWYEQLKEEFAHGN